MNAPTPSAYDWLRLVGDLNQAGFKDKKQGSESLITATARRYAPGKAINLERVGIFRIFLNTDDGGHENNYELSPTMDRLEIGGILPDRRNYFTVCSKSFQLTEGISNPKDGFRLRVVAYVESDSDDYQRTARLYCNSVAKSILSELRSHYLSQIEQGSVEVGRIYSAYRSGFILPGTFASRLCKALNAAIFARATLYCTIKNSSVYAEYLFTSMRPTRDANADDRNVRKNGHHYSRKMRSAQILDGHLLKGISVQEMENVVARIEMGEHIVLSEQQIIQRYLIQYATLMCRTDLKISTVAISPCIYDGQVIGAMIFFLGREVPTFSTSARGLVTRALENLSIPAKFFYQRRSGKMIVDPMFKSRETRVSPKTCFVVMPFGEKWSNSVYLTITDILSAESIAPIRGDDLFGENVVEDTWRAILTSDFIVADVTGRNPNVYYELGIAHTLGKRVVLLSQDVNDIPFDTRHLRHVIYRNDLSGVDAIRKGIRGFLESR